MSTNRLRTNQLKHHANNSDKSPCQNKINPEIAKCRFVKILNAINLFCIAFPGIMNEHRRYNEQDEGSTETPCDCNHFLNISVEHHDAEDRD